MAKRDKVLPARKQRDRSREDESLLMRSAESLGRMIGTLQRQLDGAGKRISETTDDVIGNFPGIPLGGGKDVSRRTVKTKKRKKKKTGGTKRAATPQRTARSSTAGARKSGSSRTRRTTRSSKKR
jgi:hypothetical protein